jgi:histidinol-phosphate aminotransferase
MNMEKTVSRRRFLGGMATIAALYELQPALSLRAQNRAASEDPIERSRVPADEYDKIAKLCFNENPFGPPPPVLEAMNRAFKYANRYGYPDGGLIEAIAALHGVPWNNVLLGAGSTEILEVVDTTFLAGHKKVVGVEPTFGTVYEYATGIEADAIRLPLRADFRQDIPAMLEAVRKNQKDIGLVYLCNPNNPTGVVVQKDEIKQLLDGLPEGIPVLIDEAYHHFVEDPNYATSIPYVTQGRPVIVARTFSKIAALAGMRLGYAVAPAQLTDRMRPHLGSNHVNVLAKWAGVAALKDTDGQKQVKNTIVDLRKKTTAELTSLGYKVIPSETNFFMVDLRQAVVPVIRQFRQRGVLVGRPFPPMLQHLRVSVGTAEEMSRFLAAFKEIMSVKTSAGR